MKTIIFIIAISLFFACQKTCDVIHKVNHSFATGMAKRWDCNLEKSEDFLNSFADKSICTKYPNERGLIGAASSVACDVIIKMVLKKVADSSAKLECNTDKVYADIKYGSNVCMFLNLIPY